MFVRDFYKKPIKLNNFNPLYLKNIFKLFKWLKVCDS